MKLHIIEPHIVERHIFEPHIVERHIIERHIGLDSGSYILRDLERHIEPYIRSDPESHIERDPELLIHLFIC